MEYRELGKTGMKASIIGLGAEHLDRKPYETVKETIDAALEHEINIMDVFMPGQEIRENIGKALGKNRNKFVIQGHIGSTDINQQYDISRDLNTCKKYFEALLKALNTDYIDFGMLFFIDSEEHFKNVFDTEIIDYVVKLKKDGTIRGIGASSHNPVIARKVIETGLVDLLMFSINPAFDMISAKDNVLEYLGTGFNKDEMLTIDPHRQELYRICESKNIPITVMKTLGAGKLLSKEHTPFSKPLTPAQCIHYALQRPAVASTLIGCESRKHVMDAVSYLNLSDEERDYSQIIKNVKSDFKGNCVYCNHCLPCPSEINIASVTKYMDIACLDENNIPASITANYKDLKSHGSDCIKCGSCEERCPFSVNIMENMETAHRLFGI